jgi:tripartite-type tricarboxylate transporter receptor subunit TctC
MIGFQQAFGKAYLAPPGVPREQIGILRSAFDAVLRDKDLLADAQAMRIEIVPQSGEAVQRVVESAYAAEPAVVARLKTIVEP